MINPLYPLLDQRHVILLDGALATELERRGADLRDPLWSAKLLLEAPALIRQVHDDYFAAGAQIAISASYQASFAGLAARGLSQAQAAELMRYSVQLALDAREQFLIDHPTALRPLVAASIGPYGATLHDGSEYRGDYGLNVAALMDWHRPRLAVLADSGADLLACETIPSLAEGEALVRLLAEFPHMPAWLSFSCCDATHVCHGEPFADCVALANQCAQLVAVGLNCTAPHHVESLLQVALPVTSKPLVAYPNRGDVWDAAAHCWLPGAENESFALSAQRWVAAGARLIGGCCRTTPADIAALAQWLDQR